ncbi:YdcF family protein [Rhodococcus sp. JVH1]|uniref:YdcF family protein n=1 Tax=Rhodococcus sp. JVH1 TaxID=745408 RepID=UPI0002FA1451|nr:YdcF family protein [Rhodococcus sp. JVH1]
MRRATTVLVGAMSALVVVVGVVGFFVYTKARVDPVKPVDAIVVLGGGHDGREEYAMELARLGVSKNLVLSNAYGTGDKRMAAYCATKDPWFTVTCVSPVPATTRGEAQFTRELAEQTGWHSILVISWRYHLPRARYIFSQCFDGEIVMRPVPREYTFSLAEWEYTYLYQTVGFIKAVVQGAC